MAKLDSNWVMRIVAHPSYTTEDYRRFQAELRRRKKPCLLEMMQRLLKQKKQNEKDNATL